MDAEEAGCEELVQDYIQWRALVLVAFNHRVLLPEIQLIKLHAL
jgi:hypothetical protein